MIDLAILGLLKDEPLHGYELRKRVAGIGAGSGFSYGSLYPALRRLERDGHILKTRPAGSIRGKKVYALTPHGNARFLVLLGAGDGPETERGFALRLAFFRHLALDARLEALQDRRAETAERLHEAHKARRAALRSATVERYTRALLDRAVQHQEVELRWIDALLVEEGEPGTHALHEELA